MDSTPRVVVPNLRLAACLLAGSALACAGVAVVLVVSVGLWWVGGLLGVLGAVVALGGVSWPTA